MKRRDLLLGVALGLVLFPLSSTAQESKLPTVAFLITHPPVTDPVVQWLRAGLAKYGYEDGRNVRLEVRTALGQLDRVPELAKELVELPADVIVIVNDVAMRAVLQETDTIPIVSIGYTNDPLGQGWIASYRRPGSNVTGVFTFNAALGAKRLEIIKETLPEASRIAVLWDPAFGGRQLDEVQQAAPRFGLELYPSVIRSPAAIDQAFDAASANEIDAMLLLWTPVFYLYRDRIADLGLKTKTPTISDIHPIVEAGGLISLGADASYPFERAGYYVSRILEGVSPSELPVERLSKLRFVVNLRTAKTLGIDIPQSILLRADEVIE